MRQENKDLKSDALFELIQDLDVRFINTLPATVGAQHAAPLLPESYALAQDLRNRHLVIRSPGSGGTQSHFTMGEVIGSMNTFTAVNPIQSSGGTSTDLASFRFQETGEFVDAEGQIVGTVAAQFLEG